MSKRKLIVEVDAEDKYCGKCGQRYFSACFQFPTSEEKVYTSLCRENGKCLRCQACLDREIKTDKQIHEELSEMVERSKKIPLEDYIPADEVMKKLDGTEVEE